MVIVAMGKENKIYRRQVNLKFFCIFNKGLVRSGIKQDFFVTGFNI